MELGTMNTLRSSCSRVLLRPQYFESTQHLSFDAEYDIVFCKRVLAPFPCMLDYELFLCNLCETAKPM